MLRRSTIGITALLLLILAAAPAEADVLGVGDSTSLASLMGSQADIFVIGDKQFDLFTYAPTDLSPIPDEVTVTGTELNGMPGLQINGFWAAETGQAFDWALGYRVQVIEGNAMISDIHLSADFIKVGTGLGIISETVRDGSGNIVASAFVSTAGPSNAMAYLDPYLSVAYIKKDLGLRGGSNGLASFSIVDQYISQNVPEPSSLLLMGIVMAGAGLVVRRRGQS